MEYSQLITDNIISVENEDDEESDYSLDYEYIGPRKAVYRDEDDNDSNASELSFSSSTDGFDMWDEDPYSTNDFTWQSNDMNLTQFIKLKQKELNSINTPWKQESFWKKEKGWPRQLPVSSSTTNHDQSANALSLVLSDFGSSEKLHTIYKDRIIECGNYDGLMVDTTSSSSSPYNIDNNTTWLDSDDNSISIQKIKFIETHASINHHLEEEKRQNNECINNKTSTTSNTLISNFIPYTKYLKRSQFPTILPKQSYHSLTYEPMCIVEKYGYMAIGGIEGEFELYCCMEEDQKPIKIWGTKFKSKDNVLLMTNSVQIVRWKRIDLLTSGDYYYNHYLIASLNDAGVLVYHLPHHQHCQQHYSSFLAHNTVASTCHLQYHHIRSFDRVPINDAKVSPDGKHLICIGDAACVFHSEISFDERDQIIFSLPEKLKIPSSILLNDTIHKTTTTTTTTTTTLPFLSSQYVAWSKSSLYFAHTSDTHNNVFVWRTKPRFEMLYRIDAGGYTYAIQFHPEREGVLAFSNRYGYLHTVDLDTCIDQNEPTRLFRVLDFDRQTTDSEGHVCTSSCVKGNEAIYHTLHIFARQEITMVSFRGEKSRRLRILAKINGLQWSKDGCYLYVATKRRVLAYEFIQSSCHIQSLEKITGLAALSVLEEKERVKRSKRKEQFENNNVEKKKKKIWHDKWNNIPPHIRDYLINNNAHLASHW
ncbi:uncharacterized protein BX663DRAFT_516590 [Cokeromyces recurvatus]|uniref:uncharacterized protein n=1 Tax=Cokeromyces recurvatus TaxID=90255 RepID=UPI00221E7C9B|nr:uncharacterized protein BX663DRAFT_516590 [Cokeromyces recurvatus]KAI7900804.1 hypothetical protein BX663DRAFT_516590 [Cokeromyces recurvatus]